MFSQSSNHLHLTRIPTSPIKFSNIRFQNPCLPPGQIPAEPHCWPRSRSQPSEGHGQVSQPIREALGHQSGVCCFDEVFSMQWWLLGEGRGRFGLFDGVRVGDVNAVTAHVGSIGMVAFGNIHHYHNYFTSLAFQMMCSNVIAALASYVIITKVCAHNTETEWQQNKLK